MMLYSCRHVMGKDFRGERLVYSWLKLTERQVMNRSLTESSGILMFSSKKNSICNEPLKCNLKRILCQTAAKMRYEGKSVTILYESY